MSTLSGFAAVDVHGLEVLGELPVELDGAYVRHGPPLSGPVGGGAMVHRVVLRHGTARYTGRLRWTASAEAVRGARAGITAHPRLDPRTGETVVFRSRLDPPYLTWSVIRSDGSGTSPVPIAGVGRPVVVHDTALTEHYVLLVLAPLFLDLPAALVGGSLLSWEPEHGTRIAVVPRDGGPVRWCHDEAFWVWHCAGAHEIDDPAAGNPVVLDHVEWARPAGLVPGPGDEHGVLARLVLDPAAGTLVRTVLDDRPVEFPRIDDRRATAPPGTIALIGHSGHHSPVPDMLSWCDPDAGTVVTWRADGLVPGEPAHAPRPATAASDRGWWLSVASQRDTGESWLLVFPAADPGAGPQARIRMPVRVPPGGHGTWLPAGPV